MFHPATSTNFRRGNAWAKGFQNPGSKTKTEAGERLRWIDRYRTVPYRTVGLQTSGKAASVWLGNRARERQGEGPHRSTMSFFSFACKMAKRCPCRLPVCPSIAPVPAEGRRILHQPTIFKYPYGLLRTCATSKERECWGTNHKQRAEKLCFALGLWPT